MWALGFSFPTFPYYYHNLYPRSTLWLKLSENVPIRESYSECALLTSLLVTWTLACATLQKRHVCAIIHRSRFSWILTGFHLQPEIRRLPSMAHKCNSALATRLSKSSFPFRHTSHKNRIEAEPAANHRSPDTHGYINLILLLTEWRFCCSGLSEWQCPVAFRHRHFARTSCQDSTWQAIWWV